MPTMTPILASATQATTKRRRRQPVVSDAPTGRTFGYVRVSSDAQVTDGQSLDVQSEKLHAWATMHSRTIDQVIVEPGVSGAIPFNERPEGGKLWADLRKGDALVAAKLDRMFRSARDCGNVVEELKDRGISLFLLDLNGGADDVSGNGIARLFLTIVSAFAEFERDRIGERIRETKRRQKAAGQYSGGVPPFGFTYDEARKMVPIPEQQAAIRKMKRLKAKGASLRAIAETLTADGTKISHVGVANALRGSAT